MKKIFFILLAIVLLGCAIDAALDFFYFKGPGKEQFRLQLEKKLNARVEVGKLVFRLLPGFQAYDVVIYDSLDRETARPWLKIQKLQLAPNYLALLAKKTIFHKIILKRPELDLVRQASGKWNIPEIDFNAETLLTEKLHIKKGTFRWVDETIGPNSSVLSLIDIDFHAKFSLDLNIRARLEGSFKGSPSEEKLNLFGSYSIPSKKFHFEGAATRFPLKIAEPYLQTELLDLKELKGEVNAQVKCDGTIGETAALTANLSSPQFHVGFTPWKIKGGLSFDGTWSWSSSQEGVRYQGGIVLENAEFLSSFLPSPITSLSGKFLFENHFLTTNGLEGELEGHSIRARGSIKNFLRPNYDASLFTDLPPDTIFEITMPFLPSALQGWRWGGKSFTQINLCREENSSQLNWNGKLYLKKATFSDPDGNLTCENLNGLVSFSRDQFSCDLTDVVVRSPWLASPLHPLQTKIQMTPPQLSVFASGPESSLLIKGTLSENALMLQQLSGYGLGATVDMQGKLAWSTLEENDLKWKTKIDAAAVKKNCPKLWEELSWLNTVNPEGAFECSGRFLGPRQPSSMRKVEMKVEGKRVALKKVFFDDLQMNVRSTRQDWSFENIRGLIGPGLLTGNALLELSQNPARYRMQWKAEGIELQRLPQPKTSPEEPLLLGNLDGELLMEGAFGQPQTAQGEARLRVTDGELGDAPLVKPIWKVLRNVAPSLDKPILQSASADFTIDKGQFVIDNMELVGPGIILQPKGKIGLDQKVDFLIQIKFFKPEGFNIKSWAIEGLNLFGKLLEVKYRGTLTHPKVDNDWLPALDKIVSGN